MKIHALNHGWQYTEECTPGFLAFEGEYESVRLPHTCRELPLHCADEGDYQFLSGYRRTLEIPTEWEGKYLALRFDGAAHHATVYVNGEKVAVHAGGYTAFTVDLTGRVAYGETCRIAVELDSRESLNLPPFGYCIDYMTFGGLYREVWLEVGEPCHLSDLFVTAELDGGISLDLALEHPEGADTVALTVRDGEGRTVASATVPHGLLAKQIKGFPCRVSAPALWTPETPNLYTLEAVLTDAGGQVLDSRSVRFGFRKAEFRADGFYLNGDRYKIRGLNRHQSYPYVGYAMPASIQRHDAVVLKEELHCNAVRTSHYPQAQAFLDACDDLGLLVFTELPGWQHIGDEGWKRVACENLSELILQYRNHPSIILWGVRINESKDDDPFYEKTNAIARALDPTRQTSGVRFLWKSHLLEDVYAFNDFSHAGTNGGLLPKKLISAGRDKGYLISEYNGHMFPTKSVDAPRHRLDHALRHATVLDSIAAKDEVAGGFGWCMADYYTHGDFGSGDHICYHGVLDMFRNPKLAAQVYAACQDTEPVLAVGSTMDIGDYPICAVGENYAFTNADSIRFYKNGELRAEFPARSKRWKHLAHPPIEITDVVGDALEKGEGWSPGKAEAVKDSLLAIQRYGVTMPLKDIGKALWRIVRYGVGTGKLSALFDKYCSNWGVSAPLYRYDAMKDGVVVASVTRQSNAQLHLEVQPSATTLMEGATYDVAAVRVRVADCNGATSAYCQLPVKLTLTGPGELIGPDIVTAEGGMCGTYVKTIGEAGEIVLTLSSYQTESVQVRFAVVCETEHHGEI